MRTILVTGGAGFIGSCLVRMTVARGDTRVIKPRQTDVRGNLDSLAEVEDNPLHVFVQGDICDRPTVAPTASRVSA